MRRGAQALTSCSAASGSVSAGSSVSARLVEGAGGVMSDWQGNPLDANSDGRVIALGDSARLEDVLEAMG